MSEYVEAAREMARRPDGGPPRWFTPLECGGAGQRVPGAPTLLYLPGVYEEWKDCQKQVNNFSGNNYQSYESREVAEEKWRRHGRKKWRNFLVITTLLLFMVGYVFYFI